MPLPPPDRLPRAGTGLYGQVLDLLGQEIIDGVLREGTIMHAAQVCERLSVSRSVVRESIRTLGSIGLVEARPQVGTRVLPASRWDLLNPHVVAWRANSQDYATQMRQLLELRLGVDATAAALAAQRLSDHDAARLLSLANDMRAAADRGDTHTFFAVDADFHRLILGGSGNAVIAQLAATISATLDARGRDTRPGMHDVTETSVNNHVALARAIVERNAAQAQAIARELVEQTLNEFEQHATPPTPHT